MTGGQWWLPQLPAKLNQGDIFESIAFIESVHPRVPLKNGPTMKGGGVSHVTARNEPAIGDSGPWLAKGSVCYGMLLNHGCDLDKDNTKRCILIPVLSLDKYPVALHKVIVTQRSIALMFLPGIPGVGNMVADFRIVTNVPRSTINASKRIASMTDDAQLRVQAQLVTFFTRRKTVCSHGGDEAERAG